MFWRRLFPCWIAWCEWGKRQINKKKMYWGARVKEIAQKAGTDRCYDDVYAGFK